MRIVYVYSGLSASLTPGDSVPRTRHPGLLTEKFFTDAGPIAKRRMTPVEEALERPEFESLDLAVDAEEADRSIEDAIKGLSTAETDEGVKYRTRDGMLVAIVHPRTTGSDDVNATLACRTEPASVSATRKAVKIREALQPHAIDG